MEKAIIAKNISKKYKFYNGTKERVFDLLFPKDIGENFYALKHIDFEAEKGDVIGFVGINGSGKSTLSNIIAGIVPATSGTVEIAGQASLIAVASGLKGDLSGRDNIELKLLMLGFNKEEIKKLEPAIIEFAELEKFIDQPVKSYSSGMKSRLGFAISVNIDPDILIIDEALSVGDKAFASKSFDKMMEFKDKGKTMIFVSHSIGQMRKFCEKILWLEFGMVKDYGSVEEILPQYEAFLNKWERMTKKEREEYRDIMEHADEEVQKQWMVENIKVENEYKEEYTSLLGRIKSEEALLYTNSLNDGKLVSAELVKEVYYIKKLAMYKSETYYLLSKSPSSKEDTIGWMKSSDLKVHSHICIDEDERIFLSNGRGRSYTKPWGAENNIVLKEMKGVKGEVFEANKTDKVGKNVWYRGKLQGREMWLHRNHLTEEK
ncbi:teichoic acids export ABC transporter ATP-binding subunit TagH [Virgibacillus halodenitrificans]|uniref:teichoic acids export ABC transporter ATP-binding subunit TagH n=1 Tax=Virgibacillus halodenitrificans TaxID=1482 RepID=UPI000EF4F08E